MYLYFDKKGTLKEIINDEALRQGNYGINKIFVYVDERSVDSIDASYLLPSGVIVGPQNYDDKTTIGSEDSYIPYNSKRDLRFFKYNKSYEFIVIDMDPDAGEEEETEGTGPLDEAGLVHCELSAILDGGNQLQLGEVNFEVQVNSVLNQHYVAEEQYLSLANYQFLRKLISGGYEPIVHNFVPYEGATKNLDLGNHNFKGNTVNPRFLQFTNTSANEDVTISSTTFTDESGEDNNVGMQIETTWSDIPFAIIPGADEDTLVFVYDGTVIERYGVEYDDVVEGSTIGNDLYETAKRIKINGDWYNFLNISDEGGYIFATVPAESSFTTHLVIKYAYLFHNEFSFGTCITVPEPPASGTKILKSVNGTLSWADPS